MKDLELEKGKIWNCRVINVGNACTDYQDKSLWPVLLRSADSNVKGMAPHDGDFSALEVTIKGQESILKDKIGEVVDIVSISPAGRGRPGWIKMDKPMIVSDLQERDKMFIAQHSFRIAADLIIADKSGNLGFDKIDALALKVANKTIALSKQI